MNKLKPVILTISCILLLFTCKKEVKVTENVSIPGTVFSNGAEHFLGDVIKTADDHFILAGTALNGKNGMFDYFALKVDNNFNTIWYKNYGGKYFENFSSAASDENGNIMLAGISNSFGVSVDSLKEITSYIFYLVNIDKNGDIIWEKSYQPYPNLKNIDNEAKVIFYLKNQTFSVLGSTNNVLSNADVFGFTIDKQASITSTKRFNNDPISPYNYEYCQNAVLSEDGNIIFQMRNDTSSTSKMNLLKIESGLKGPSINKFIWMSPFYYNFINMSFSPNNDNNIAMASCGGDKVAFGDKKNKRMILTDDFGRFSKSISFRNPTTISNITKSDNTLIVIGFSETPNGGFSSCHITDLEGNILEEIYFKLNSSKSPQISIYRVFFNNKNEIMVFGTYPSSKGQNIVMLKFDHNGNIIKN